MSWINMEQKKPKWRSMHLLPRFNHKMITVQIKGKDYIAVFGGRDQKMEIINDFFLIGVNITDG